MKVKILVLAFVSLLLFTIVPSQGKIKQNKELLLRAVEFHGHLGPYLVLGLRAGLYANQIFGKEPMNTKAIIETKTTPPQSCSADGVQFSTGCTLGKGNISLKEGEGLAVTFEKDKKKLILKLRKKIIEEIDSLPSEEEAWENLAEDLYKRSIEIIFEIVEKK
ncbi:MAG: formylmethanofuran dehydrogenase subunit E family protein [Candidatus Aminicenantaceae bacterium]